MNEKTILINFISVPGLKRRKKGRSARVSTRKREKRHKRIRPGEDKHTESGAGQVRQKLTEARAYGNNLRLWETRSLLAVGKSKKIKMG